MRRSEFIPNHANELISIANNCIVGYLGMVDPKEYPRVIPLNFILQNNCIYFHGADEGDKFDVFQTNPKVTFSMVEMYSMIPSYWIAKDYACPATVFFKSVYIIGKGNVVNDLEQKAMMLQGLMEKYQPEGNYKEITTKDSLYKQALEEVIIFKIAPGKIDCKFKFGQNMSVNKRKILIEKLKERNNKVDLKTAEEIKKTFQPVIDTKK
ncbi:MAG: flavin-nucleotide-binding protein [Candidatus Marinimicrobia bacterium]|jgi:hypothetical protein|nr:flavin-nucleotide-binding protein [Candidatus Neomarinimicrobiota bacterium]MBT3618321.1 flavin-nucleotide-binding protein [Candidatus Neomarinimicrobiota bacterium]MBT3828266.1 flavin-nucleotide-binding protein [Candidatus Neomarinimicrobiota bacterium]MBT3997183.1 flavin-nucleotide-binding protein [Candidatus Neomarinimicrobiota bacterium]MBT4280649.1 flavin-nucleotide-binding protein [Candidatus Neomarinimicrobiota bacterium]